MEAQHTQRSVEVSCPNDPEHSEFLAPVRMETVFVVDRFGDYVTEAGSGESGVEREVHVEMPTDDHPWLCRECHQTGEDAPVANVVRSDGAKTIEVKLDADEPEELESIMESLDTDFHEEYEQKTRTVFPHMPHIDFEARTFTYEGFEPDVIERMLPHIFHRVPNFAGKFLTALYKADIRLVPTPNTI